LYRLAVGGDERDWMWKGQGQRWVKGKLHGYDMLVSMENWSNRKTYFLERFYDLATQLLLQEELGPGDTFIDIGANEGMMSLLASKIVGEQGRVVAFEPNPKALRVFRDNIERNGIKNIEVRPIGLSDAPTTLQLTVPKAHTGRGTFAGLSTGEPTESVSCQVCVGDEELAGLRPKLIKIDVEGFEERVLKGLRQTITTHRPVIVLEMLDGLLRKSGSSFQDVANFFADLSYQAGRLTTERASLTKHRLRIVASDGRDGDYVWRPVTSHSSAS
jgi:FkbM family methyltransferase